MLIALNALQAELDASLTRERAVTLLPMLGFPIDGAEETDGTVVLDVDITANRGDMMSHRGVSRELAAKLGAPLMALPHKALNEGAPAREIRLEARECPVYATATLALGKGPTPEAASAFLITLGAGVKQLAAVDASNELLHRYGHPTHAFDDDTLKGAITIRFAKRGETLVTLDGVERKLTTEDLVIADETGPVALAGVMGGERTKVTEATARVLLESAYFDPRMVRLMARRHNLHTDASARFGRGADPAMAQAARDLLVDRLQAWNGATLEAAWSVGAIPEGPAPIGVCEAMVARMAGEAVSASEIAALLQRLGCTTTIKSDHVFAVPPTWRHDLIISEDLAEEVLRLRGYDHLPEALPPVQSEPEPLSPDYLKRQHLARRLANLGFHQTVTYGFVSPEMDATHATTPAEGRALGNPLGVEYSLMRGSLLPSLEAAARHNQRNGAREVRLFEQAPVYASAASGPVASERLGLVWSGVQGGEDPLTPSRAVHPLDVAAIAQDLGATAISVKELGEGLFGLELDLAALPAQAERVIPAFRAFSRFPSLARDLSLLVSADQRYGPLAEAMRKALPPECSDLRCVDIYRGKGLEPGQQAWLIRMTFQADRTLTSEEADGWVKAALAAAESTGAKLRG
ncbi:MAG TPA: phenylalanine--tRNA ligase subunit beta [Holophagaceae bacterium]|jgi:phenylalanyl-tRNA synthetase beta chain|nr:phenylalanine--tRNA ligase subunit beta [Holophagaceae bacterium]